MAREAKRDVDLPFQLSEYEGRLERVRESASARGLEVLLVTSPTNIYYLTGFDSFSFYSPQFLVVPLEEDPFMVPRSIDRISVRDHSWLGEDNIIPYGEEYVDHYVNYPDPRHPVDFLVHLFRKKGLTSVRLGVELDNYYCRAFYYRRLREELPGVEVQNATQLVPRLYLRKSDAEIEYMKEASRIVEKGMRTAVDAISEGVKENEIAAKILETTVMEGSCTPSIPPFLQTTGACHRTWTEEEITRGTSVSIEIAGCKRRYQSPMCRTVIVDEGSSPVVTEAREVLSKQIDAHRKALETVRPGIRAERVAEEANRIFSERSSRIGYPAGLGFPPDWGERTASFQEGDQTVLEPNMTFHVISTLTEPFMMEFSETIRVTEDGAEVLAEFPRKLFVR